MAKYSKKEIRRRAKVVMNDIDEVDKHSITASIKVQMLLTAIATRTGITRLEVKHRIQQLAK